MGFENETRENNSTDTRKTETAFFINIPSKNKNAPRKRDARKMQSLLLRHNFRRF